VRFRDVEAGSLDPRLPGQEARPRHLQDAEQAGTLPPFAQNIRFEQLALQYPGTDKPVLSDIDFEVKRGEVVALVGRSGAGKTSLVNLVPRFIDVTAGRVLIDGYDVRDVTQQSLRNQIALVTQEIILFNDTVLNNIAYGHEEMDRSRVEAIARAANAHEFIIRLPQGYDTVVGERGAMLSGGQRQRLSLARALLKDAPILILDEATSALDTESERLVQQAIDRLMEGRTVIVIAHRLSTIRHADRIIVLDQGRVVQTGRHAELIAAGGLYAELYHLQFETRTATTAADTENAAFVAVISIMRSVSMLPFVIVRTVSRVVPTRVASK